MMKKILMTVAVLGCAASIVSAQTVSSANIVGYNKTVTTEGKFSMPGAQFVTSTGNTVNEMFADSLPLKSKIYIWNGDAYDIVTYDYHWTSAGFPPVDTTNGVAWTEDNAAPSAITIPAGIGFWVTAPAGSSATYESIISGEVIVADSVTNTVASGLSMLSSAYPVEVAITNAGFSATLKDKIYMWNGDAYDIVTYDYHWTSAGFPPVDTTNGVAWTSDNAAPTADALMVGEGFWYDSKNGSDVEWIMTRPFTID